MKPSIDCLKNLHAGQLQQLRVFIEILGYRKAAERASEEFNQSIHKTALQRFMRRAAPAEFLEDTPENDEATRQILKFAADGQPDFTASSLRALERLAFQLSLTCTAVEDDMNALTKINTMLCRFRNASVRERMAAVQEGKLKLRQQQLEKATNPDHDAQIQELNAKITAAFDQHPVLTAIRNAEDALGSAGIPPAPADLPPDLNPNLTPNPTPNPNLPPAVPPKTKNSEAASSAQSAKPALPLQKDPNAQPEFEIKSPQRSTLNENQYENRNPQCEIRDP